VNFTSINLKSNKYIKVIFLFYILLLLKMSFWGLGTFPIRIIDGYSDVSQNIIPFKSIINYLVNFEHYNFITWFYNTFGNILLFFPLGILISLFFVSVNRFTQVMYLSIFVSFSIEITQYITTLGVFDVDDVILNTLGSILGFSILLFVRKRR
jgi:glycopeptide antibiotics resistance protein